MTLVPSAGPVYIGKSFFITCQLKGATSTDTPITPRISWQVFYSDQGELVSTIFEAASINEITSFVFLSTLHYDPIMMDMNFTCTGYFQSNESNDSLLDSISASTSMMILAPGKL